MRTITRNDSRFAGCFAVIIKKGIVGYVELNGGSRTDANKLNKGIGKKKETIQIAHIVAGSNARWNPPPHSVDSSLGAVTLSGAGSPL